MWFKCRGLALLGGCWDNTEGCGKRQLKQNCDSTWSHRPTPVFKKTALDVFFWRMLALLLTGNGKLRHGVGKGMGFFSVQHLDLSI